MDLWAAKLLAAIVLFVLTLVLSFISYFTVLRGSRSLVPARPRDKVITYMSCMAGGIFMAALLVHILVEGGQEFELYKTLAKVTMTFPLFNVFVAIGFFFVAFFEAVVQLYHSRGDVDYATFEEEGANGIQNSSSNTDISLTTRSGSGGAAAIYDGTQIHNGIRIGEDGRKLVSVRAFLLLIALSLDSIFAGQAIGLQIDAAKIWSSFAAVAINKSFIAFCLGLELFLSNSEKPVRAMVCLIVYSLMFPLGIGIGVALMKGTMNIVKTLLATSILKGFIGGTVMYTAFLGILSPYVNRHTKGRLLYILFAVAGFGIMACVKELDTK